METQSVNYILCYNFAIINKLSYYFNWSELKFQTESGFQYNKSSFSLSLLLFFIEIWLSLWNPMYFSYAMVSLYYILELRTSNNINVINCSNSSVLNFSYHTWNIYLKLKEMYTQTKIKCNITLMITSFIYVIFKIARKNEFL